MYFIPYKSDKFVDIQVRFDRSGGYFLIGKFRICNEWRWKRLSYELQEKYWNMVAKDQGLINIFKSRE